MTNSSMKESTEKEAVLDGVEPEALARLVKFAYVGLCGITNTASVKVLVATTHSP